MKHGWIFRVIPLLVAPLLSQCGGGGDAGVDAVKSAVFESTTWGEAVESVSEEAPVWTSGPLPDGDADGETHFGVRADVVRGGKKGFVLFKVSADGSRVEAAAMGTGDKTEVEGAEKIEEVFSMLMLAKGFGDSEALAASQARGIEIKNRAVLQHHALWAISAAVADPEGNFPESLEAVRKGSPNEDHITMTDPNTGQGEIDPTYFPGLKRDADPKLILLACPFSNADGTRTVAYTDMSAERIAEADFQAKVAAQGGE